MEILEFADRVLEYQDRFLSTHTPDTNWYLGDGFEDNVLLQDCQIATAIIVGETPYVETGEQETILYLAAIGPQLPKAKFFYAMSLDGISLNDAVKEFEADLETAILAEKMHQEVADKFMEAVKDMLEKYYQI